MHRSSLSLMSSFATTLRERLGTRPARVLDVGSGDVNGSYRALFESDSITYVGLDIEPGPNVDVAVSDPYDWCEVEDASFDAVISGQALEHIPFPWVTVEQVARKLKPGGTACLIAPSRGPVHRYPVDCYRFYPDGMRALAKWAGLEVLEADYFEGKTGFDDGSNSWGDCHCVLRKPDAESGAAPRRAARAVPRAGKHSKNPMRQPLRADYFARERGDVIEVVEALGVTPRAVLELGCSAGATGARLKASLGVDHYVGIEPDWRAAEQARERLDEILAVDVEEVDLQALGLEEEAFDLLLALDVLEHLYDPWDVLWDLCRHLRPGGHVVISVPNTRHHSVLQGLAAGRWRYTDAGLLDATHIRFFTLHEVRELLTGAGLELVRTAAVQSPGLEGVELRDTGNTLELDRVTLRDLTRQDMQAFFTYQYILAAKKPG